MSKTFTDAVGTSVDNSLFDQLTTMTKAHAYDIISEKCQELEIENKKLKFRIEFLENLIKESTEKMLNNLK